MTDRELALRAEIMRAFADTGEPPDVPDGAALRALSERHVVVLDEDARIVMAHPFAAHPNGARVDADGRTWWGNCAWDGFGIVAALDVPDATITAQGIAVSIADGEPRDAGAVFHVAVPAAHWWDDIAHT